ncbi:MAG: DUF1553 domain-containing protein [Pirellulaceae bacterium]|nr:DUF1553 domain-containing protein [Pirellulaceae bacterium]
MKSILPIALAFLITTLPSASLVAQERVDFLADIKPILAENCLACHGLHAEARQADLRLDVRQDAIDAGAIMPGDPGSSSLIERINETDEDLLMPPPTSHKSLTVEQKALLKQWVSEGADYQQHWSLVAPQKPGLPAVKHAEWPKNAIDHFILAGLENSGLNPAKEADPHTLFRRLNLDITGLPPRPQDTVVFLADYKKNPDDAVSQWIDQLMNRSSWGEHRGRYWLDAARYADTHGMHFDNYREMWPYRDWVIQAFNANQAFDQFTIEQLAGDLLENPSREQLIATGFQRCNMTTNEGGTIDEENLAMYAADRVQTFGWVYLGMTANCAQCHDHKFDPISIKDYYSLAAFFRNTTQKPKDGNRKDGLGPTIVVAAEKDRQRWDALPSEISTAAKLHEQRRVDSQPDFERWLTSMNSATIGQTPVEGMLLHLPLNDGDGNEVRSRSHEKTIALGGSTGADEEQTFRASGSLVWEKDGVIGPAPRLTKDTVIELGDFGDFAINQPFSVGCWVKTTGKRSGAIIGRMDNQNGYRGWDLWQNDNEFAAHIIDKWTENGLKVITQGNRVKPGQWQHVFATWDGSGKAEGIKIYVDGKAAKTRVARASLKPDADTRTATPLNIGSRNAGQSPLEGFVQDFLLYERVLTPGEVANVAEAGPLRLAFETPAEERSAELKKTLFENYLRNHDSTFMALDKKLNELQAEQGTIRDRSPVTHVQVEKETSPTAKILMRGAYDKPGEEVSAATPAAFHPLPNDAPRNRLGLAQWVIDPANPLTARVTVNRFWQEIFGAGIVATAEDFGVMGTLPSNQDLLDWLAVDFRYSGWDVKRFFKQVMMSAAYRQASRVTDEKLLRDRDNSLLSRGPRFRMDAEMVRDFALSASGLLNEKMYGPGTKPYQPDDLWNIVGLPGGDTRNFTQDKGDEVYRRSLYSFWKRMSPPPNLEAFNAPNREVCTVRRERTNTPLQALVTLNDPQFFEAARVLAQNAMTRGDGDWIATLSDISARTLCRPLTPQETKILRTGFDDFVEHYESAKEDAQKLITVGQTPHDEKLDLVRLAAWTMVCNQILNLDEILNK